LQSSCLNESDTRQLTMKCATLITALFAAALASEVKVLTEDNFDETIKSNANVLVEFYAPWCGHCKKLAPEYDAASLKLKGEDVVLAKVDATEEGEVAEKYEVRGYPTLIWFKNGKSKEYDGGRSTDTIVSWVMKKIGPVLTELKTAEEVEGFKKKGDAVVIASIGEDDIPTLKSVAEDMDNPFGYITDASVAKDAEVDGIVVFKTFDEGKASYDGKMDKKEITSFVSAESIPLVMTWKDNQEMMGKLDAPLLFSVHDGSDIEGVTNAMKDAAKAKKGKYLFYTVDAKHDPNSRLLEFFGVKAGETVVFSQSDRKKFFFRDSDLSGLEGFLTKVESGEQKPEFKSEEPPSDNTKPVTVLVGKEFDAIVKDTTKDVFVEFYAPWCGHCKKLAPTWDKLGEHYKDDDSVIIAKMDATANEVPEPEVRGFPTLYFFPADNKSGLKYEGERSLESFIEYIDEKGTAAKSAAATGGKDEL